MHTHQALLGLLVERHQEPHGPCADKDGEDHDGEAGAEARERERVRHHEHDLPDLWCVYVCVGRAVRARVFAA